MNIKNEQALAQYLKQIIQQKCDSKSSEEAEGDLQCFNDFSNLKEDYDATIYEWIYEQPCSKFTDEPSEIVLLCRWETSDKQMIPFQASFHTENEAHWLLAYAVELESLLIRFRCIIKNGICCMEEIFVSSFERNRNQVEVEVDIFKMYLESETIH